MKFLKYMILCLLIVPLYAQLGDYVLKFDPHLAIHIYEGELKEQGDTTYYLALARTYSLIEEESLADSCYRIYLMTDASADVEYMTFLYEKARFTQLRDFAAENNDHLQQSMLFTARSWLKEGNFDKASQVSRKYDQDEFRHIYELSQEGNALVYRSPALGGLMSVVLPGSGKAYAGRWLDGFQALVMIATPAVNSYYHFKKYGVKSIRAWLWGGSAAWLYLSDIYGAVKAVKQYNKRLRQSIIRKLDS